MPLLAVYLIRHEDAEDADATTPDAHRALTGLGRRRMRTTSKLLAEHADAIDVIYTSPLVRAVQTAEILAEAIGFEEPIAVRAEIASPPSLRVLARVLEDTPVPARGVVMVGHEPTLPALARALLGGGTSPHAMSKGSVLALDYDRDTRAATFRWWIVPDGPARRDTL